MSKVDSIEKLREHALNTIEKLADGDIDIGEAAATQKLYESVISSCKAEMEYVRLTGRKSRIPFLDCGRGDIYDADLTKQIGKK